MVLTVIKTEEVCMPWDESGDYLTIDRAVAGVKVA
jgi:hypothetical protein